jgi:secreted trypsin-like serine protease
MNQSLTISSSNGRDRMQSSAATSLTGVITHFGLWFAILFSVESACAQGQSRPDSILNVRRPSPASISEQRPRVNVPDGPSGKIIGGDDAKPGNFKWQVAVIRPGYADPFDGFFCGGSLIDWQWVLTAAHCTFQDNPLGKHLTPVKIADGAISVYVGSQDFTNGEAIVVDRIIRNKLYDPDSEEQENDIALLHLRSAPKNRSRVELIELVEWPGDADRLAINQRVTVLGWGSTTAGVIPANQRQSVRKLQFIERATVQDSTVCNNTHRNNRIKVWGDYYVTKQKKTPVEANQLAQAQYPPGKRLVTAKMLCAGTTNGTQDSCFGDSGGPLVFYSGDRNKLVQGGIVSWGPLDGCGLTSLYGVYVRLSEYLDWIKDNKK